VHLEAKSVLNLQFLLLKFENIYYHIGNMFLISQLFFIDIRSLNLILFHINNFNYFFKI